MVPKQTEKMEEIWQACLSWALEKDPDFARQYQRMGFGKEPCALEDLPRLPESPITGSESPFERLNLPLSSLERWIGKTAYLTQEIDVWKDCAQSWLRSCGIHRASVVLVADGFGGAGAAWGILEGIRSMGAVAMTNGAAPWEIADMYGITACALTTELLGKWVASGRKPACCRQIFCLTSDLDAVRRDQWQAALGVPIYRQIGLEGIQASAIFWEDRARKGYRYLPQYYVPELVGDSNGPGRKLLLTALQRRSTTAIRMRTDRTAAWQQDPSRRLLYL